jgi:DNA polymerase I-like protein with 3'-5' exonuclease and polymerase domains
MNAAPGSPVFIDLETGGLKRHHRIASVGVLVDDSQFILFLDSHSLSIARHRITQEKLHEALAPLGQREDLVAVFHNAVFDLGFLQRAGIEIRCAIHDTRLMMLLADPDRNREGLSRISLPHRQPLNYRLKDVVLHELNVDAPHFPGAAAGLGYRNHVRYLTSDCLITKGLYEHLLTLLTGADIDYYRRLIAPVTPMLVDMTNLGVQADLIFLKAECDKLSKLIQNLSTEHTRRFGQRLDAGDFQLRGWVYLNKTGLRCYLPKDKWVRVGQRRLPPLDVATLREIYDRAANPQTRDSLALIRDYLLGRSLLVKLATLRDKHVDPHTHRIHTSLGDWQASGRISSTNPNLQAIAKTIGPDASKEFISDRAKGTVVRSRNVLRASDGFTLVAFDIAQADVRCLAHVVESLKETGQDLVARLKQQREDELDPQVLAFTRKQWDHFRPENRKKVICPRCAMPSPAKRMPHPQLILCTSCQHNFSIEGTCPNFNPEVPGTLAEDFRKGGTDFYTTATTRMLGRPPKNKAERNAMKQTILGIVNGMSAPGLAGRLGISSDEAKSCLQKFADAYPKETAYIDLMHHVAAIKGYAESFCGRRRRVTPHYWMVNEPEVELLLSYRGADKLWVRVVPLSSSRHTLTCWVKSVVDARYDSPRHGQEIYHHQDGRISQAYYRFFEDNNLIFGLPVRNISWRLIRRVRTKDGESRYQGFDKVRRQLTNHIFQGSTADIARIMMLRSKPVCNKFQGRLLLQIHDELLFEVPGSPRQVMRFIKAMSQVLEEQPTADFRVPIVVEPKMGVRFGELRDVKRREYSANWLVFAWNRFLTQWASLMKRFQTVYASATAVLRQ